MLCLGDANNSFRGAGFPGRYDDAARAAAEVLLSALEPVASTERLVITPPSTQSRTLNPMVRATSGGGDPDFLRALVESLPAAAFVIDTDGNVQFATRAAADLVECAPDDLVGRSVLEFVDEDTAWAYAAAVAMAGDHPNVVMGPMRIIVVAGEGRSKPADLWATNRLDDPDVNGIVCLLTAETTAVGLADAIGAVANDADFPTVATRVVRAMQGHPTVAQAVLLSAGPSGFRTVASSRDDLPETVAGGPWDDALFVGCSSGGRHARRATARDRQPPGDAASRRYGSNRSATSAQPPRGVLVLWREHPGRPTPNELNAVHQAAAILTLAWERHESKA